MADDKKRALQSLACAESDLEEVLEVMNKLKKIHKNDEDRDKYKFLCLYVTQTNFFKNQIGQMIDEVRTL